MRLGPSKDLGFDADARSENLRRSIEIAKLTKDNGMMTICAFVAPSEAVRQKAKAAVGEDFLLAYLDAPLAVCQARDVEGIYKAAASAGLETIPGVNLPYEVPSAPDIVLYTAEMEVEECVERLMVLLGRG